MSHTLLPAKIRILQPPLIILIYKNNTSSVNCKQRSLIKIEICERDVELLKVHLDALKQLPLDGLKGLGFGDGGRLIWNFRSRLFRP